MTLPGMKSTADFAADERPKDWRTALMINEPRNGAPLFRLTAAMKSERTTDPEFKWWEEDVQLYNFELGADIADGAATTITLTQANGGASGLTLKAGDMLILKATGEAIRVATVVSATSITVTRAVGPNGTPAGTAAGVDIPAASPKILYVGSGYREGAPRAVGVSFNPTQYSNVTQIFRDPIEWTRTAMATEYRTGNPMANDRRRALNKHSIGIERALWLGTRYETLEAGQPLRFTQGLLGFIPSENQSTFSAGGTDMDELEDKIGAMFAWGSNEKLVFGSLASLLKINRIVRKNTQYNWGPGEKEYGMNVKRLYTAAGTIVFTEHPLFGQAGNFLEEDFVAVDTAKLRWRYVDDTKLLKDREDKGTDGKCEEYLTEGGLELGNPKAFYWLKGLKSALADD